MGNLIHAVLAGERLALSRALSQVENGTQAGRQMLTALFPHTGQAHLIGVTGAPGTGKSSLVNMLARHFRQPPAGQEPRRVAIVAVDPSSPFSGGAILGDRIRMRDLAGDAGVFIRSMASRGSLGGLASATAGVVQIYDAAGFDVVLIETVGVGQAEVDIARLAHTTIVIEAPGLGDDIQAIKAGILEIADILVVNKADHPGVDSTERALRGMLELAHPGQRQFLHHNRLETVPAHASQPSSDAHLWIPPIQRTIATEGTGIPELAQAIAQHLAHLQQSGAWHQRERSRLQAELDLLLQETLVARWRETVTEAEYQAMLDNLVQRKISPHQAVQALLNGGLVR
ncbi:MAG: methylmalonyl Co-A mutase-associated GTPase MeaB [Anaerolineales bacterium]|nr:methylmalonyl Co-A mutase-associated GTPase MeaB [Anaerolineales bacterium]